MATNLSPRWKCFVPFVSVGALLLLTSCIGTDEMRWKEQVWLHDGKFVLIDRYSTRAKSGFPNSRRGVILSQEIRYDPLGVLWSVDGSDEQPISFEIIDGAAYLAATAPYSREKFCRGKPKGAYVAVFYRWTNGKKQRISQQETPVDRMGNNISGISQWGYSKKEDRTYLSWNDVADATGQPWSGPPVLLRDRYEKEGWRRCE